MDQELRAFMVCVDYSDLLTITLPRNIHHFAEINIITSERDPATINYCTPLKSYGYPINLYVTEAFYENGADFNKWKALEEGLDHFGRNGWICLMDADVVWPTVIPTLNLRVGKLYTPLRRMFGDVQQPVPPEYEWKNYPVHRNITEWAGYSQIFHSTDPVLGPAPWHETNWKHAGGADSYFQMKWSNHNKIRPPFEVLHLGPAGENWAGRATTLTDGSIPETAQSRTNKVREYVRSRKKYRTKPGTDIHKDEKIN